MNRYLVGNRKILILLLAAALMLSGCAGKSPESDQNTETTQAQSDAKASGAVMTSDVTADEAIEKLIADLKEKAENGKAIGSDFALKQVIEDVINTYGEPSEQPEWHAQGKGIFISFADRQLEFGYNKGSEIFEIKSRVDAVKQIRYTDLIASLGEPDYLDDQGSVKTLGYIVNDEYKLLFVLTTSPLSPEESAVTEYSVFYPAATVNLMADDPGREW